MAGAFMYMKGKKGIQGSIWLVYNILFTTWNFSIYKALSSIAYSRTLYWLRVSVVAFIFMMPVFLHFLSIYSDRKVFKKQIINKIYIVFFLFFAASFTLPDQFVKGITSGIYFKYIILPGPAFHFFVAVSAGFIFAGFYYLLKSSKTYLSFKRNQRVWIFFGMLLGLLAPINFLLAAYKITFFPAGLFFVIPYLALVTYIMMKYHVLEIDIIVNKTVVFAYFILFVLLLHMLIVYVLNRIVGIEYFISSVLSGSVVLLNLLFILHYEHTMKLNRITSRIIYEKKLNYYKFLEDVTLAGESITDVSEMANYVLGSLIDTVRVETATLYLYDEDKVEFKLVAWRGVDKTKIKDVLKISLGSPLINFLREGNVYAVEEDKDLDEDYDLEKIQKAFMSVNTRFSIPLYYSLPLYHSKEMIGFLNLGHKKDNSEYNKEDIDIVNAFGRQLSVCIDNANLYSRAVQDDLTKLYRVGYLNKRMEEEIERASRYSRELCFIIIDVDDFKRINDRFGHQTGDEVLKKIARLIKMSVRKTDISARYGGEEFGVLMPETVKQKAVLIGERIRKTIEEEFKNQPGFKVTVSIGIADCSPGMQRKALIETADRALYVAKREGKNKVC